MDPFTGICAALLIVGGLAFLGMPLLVSRPFKLMPSARALVTRALSCVIGIGYVLGAYLVFREDRASGTIAIVLGCTGTLNIILVILEWPYLKRA